MTDTQAIDNLAVNESTEPIAAVQPGTVEEPQTELTKKFTEEEWKALKELRVCFFPLLKARIYDKLKHTLV